MIGTNNPISLTRSLTPGVVDVVICTKSSVNQPKALTPGYEGSGTKALTLGFRFTASIRSIN